MLHASVAFRSPLPPACLRIWSVPLENSIKIKPRTPKLFRHSEFHCHSNLPMPPKALKFIVEYSKTGHSRCKICSEIITKKAPRIGLVRKNRRGFDKTKWHHANCFGLGSESIDSVASIQGFDSLKAAGQDALAKLLEKHDEAKKGVSRGLVVAYSSSICDSKEYTADRDALTKLLVLDKHYEAKQAASDQDALTKLLDKHDQAKKEVSITDEVKNDTDERSVKKQGVTVTSADAAVKIALPISDIKDMYKGFMLPPRWKAYQTIIFLERDDGLKDSNKIAAFDFDGCLVESSVKRIGANAWSLMYPSIPDKLQKLYNDGYKLVIFTNESNIEHWNNKIHVAVESKIGRLDQFIQRVKVPIQVFIACGYNDNSGVVPFWKPKPGMWHIMEKHFNSGIQIDLNESFYVGDAAGRETDHSDADIKFAQAIGLKFYLPEDYWKCKDRPDVESKFFTIGKSSFHRWL